VNRSSFDPTGLDIDILREMYREGAVNIAGVDPRLNATQIAQRLHVGRRRVAARLKMWKELGFLRHYDVWVNPALLGARGGWLSLRVDNPRVKPDLFRRLGLVDGVVSALDFLGEWVSVGLLASDDATLARKAALIRNLVGVREVEGPAPWLAPLPKRSLTPLELRIVRALRVQPDATLTAIARRVGVSTRTMTRHYSDLVDDWAVWFVPVFDFTALAPPVVSLNLTLRSGTPPEGLVRTLRKRFPLVLESRFLGEIPGSSAEIFLVFVVLPSAARFEDLHHYVETLEGVDAVEPLSMVRMHVFPEWFDRELSGLVAATSAPRSRTKPA
jgi:DNA-binding Lrp family transcriptional regulator